MAYTDIDKPSDYFISHIWSGTSSNHTESIGMQPDFVWVKGRSVATDHTLFDVVRGFTVGKSLGSNTSAAEDGSNTTAYGGIGGVTSDGFTVTAGSSNADYVNTSGRTYASWNWKANGTGSANTDGSISSTVSANTTSGFSIVKYTGNGTAGATIGHGLGTAPDCIIMKELSNANDWFVYHQATGATNRLKLNSTTASATSTFLNNTTPTSSVYAVDGGAAGNTNSTNYIAYCFADVQGYSKFGSYLGNSADDGTFVYTGFKPALIMVKRTNSTGNWVMHDNRRSLSNGFNVNQYILYSNTTTDEITDESKVDLLSNGFKFRNALTDQNANGSTYIYMAFAKQPLVGTNNVPATAR